MVHVFSSGAALLYTGTYAQKNDGCSEAHWYATASGNTNITAAVQSHLDDAAECYPPFVVAVLEGAIVVGRFVDPGEQRVLVWGPSGTGGSGRIAFDSFVALSDEFFYVGAVASREASTTMFLHLMPYYPAFDVTLTVVELDTSGEGTWTPVSLHRSASLPASPYHEGELQLLRREALYAAIAFVCPVGYKPAVSVPGLGIPSLAQRMWHSRHACSLRRCFGNNRVLAGRLHAVGRIVSLGDGSEPHQVYVHSRSNDFMHGVFDLAGFSFTNTPSFRYISAQSRCVPLRYPDDRYDDQHTFTGTFIAVPLAPTGTPTATFTVIGTMQFPTLSRNDYAAGTICLTVPPSAATVADISVLATSTIKVLDKAGGTSTSNSATVSVTYASCTIGSGCSSFSSTPWAGAHVGDVAQL